MMRSLLRSGVVAALLLAGLAGCAQDPVPQDLYYRLSVPLPASESSVASPGDTHRGIVEVDPFQTDGLLTQVPVVFRTMKAGKDDPAGPLRQYTYHLWAQPLSDAMQRALIARLRDSHLFADVVSPDLRARADYDLRGRLLRFDHLRDDSGHAAVDVAFEVSLTRRQDHRVLMTRRYADRHPVPDETVDSAVRVGGEVVATLYGQMTQDLSAVLATDGGALAR